MTDLVPPTSPHNRIVISVVYLRFFNNGVIFGCLLYHSALILSLFTLFRYSNFALLNIHVE